MASCVQLQFDHTRPRIAEGTAFFDSTKESHEHVSKKRKTKNIDIAWKKGKSWLCLFIKVKLRWTVFMYKLLS